MNLAIGDSGVTVGEVFTAPVTSGFALYDWIYSHRDPRVDDWPMMGSPFPTVAVFITYLLITRYAPRFMQNRKPFKLQGPLIVYNMGITILNGWMACELLYCAYMLNYNPVCQMVAHTSKNQYELRIANAVWWYYVSKAMEFMDTFFFILRKKDSQMSFLHLYHHSTMFCVWWVGARFVPGGSVVMAVAVNCVVHVLMYSYYALAACGPHIQRYLWWKKYLTMMQLVQFTAGVGGAIYLISTGCQFTRWMQYGFLIYALSFLLLFSEFYHNTYMLMGDGRRPGNKKDQAAAAITSNKQKSSVNGNTNGNSHAINGSSNLTYRGTAAAVNGKNSAKLI